jgi:hypothetical protein
MTLASREKDLRRRFKAVTLAYITFGLENPETYRLLFMSDAEYNTVAFKDQREDDPAGKCFSLLVNVADELRREVLNSRGLTALEIAELVWATSHGAVSLNLACAGLQTPAERFAEIVTCGLIGSRPS